MIQRILILTILISLITSLKVFARAEYDELPKLNGKVDEKYKKKTKRTINGIKPSYKVSTTAPKLDLANYQNTMTETKNDEIFNKIKTNKYATYQKDLNTMVDQLKILRKSIEEGNNIQFFSAIVTNSKIQFNIMERKYNSTNESSFESYRLIQSILHTSQYTKDIWIKSNKLTRNKRHLSSIINTKLMQIKVLIDQLVDLNDIQDSLTIE